MTLHDLLVILRPAISVMRRSVMSGLQYQPRCGPAGRLDLQLSHSHRTQPCLGCIGYSPTAPVTLTSVFEWVETGMKGLPQLNSALIRWTSAVGTATDRIGHHLGHAHQAMLLRSTPARPGILLPPQSSILGRAHTGVL